MMCTDTHHNSHTYCSSVWGALYPYQININGISNNTAKATKIPLPPFSSFNNIRYVAGICTTISFVYTFTSGGLILARQKDDILNNCLCLGAVAGYTQWLFKKDANIIWTNRIALGVAVTSIIYANTGYEVDSVYNSPKSSNN